MNIDKVIEEFREKFPCPNYPGLESFLKEKLEEQEREWGKAYQSEQKLGRELSQEIDKLDSQAQRLRLSEGEITKIIEKLGKSGMSKQIANAGELAKAICALQGNNEHNH